MDAFVGTWKARQPANDEEKAQFIAFCIAEADGGTGGSIKYLFFFEDFEIYSGVNWPLSVSPRCQCVYTMTGQTPALAAEL